MGNSIPERASEKVSMYRLGYSYKMFLDQAEHFVRVVDQAVKRGVFDLPLRKALEVVEDDILYKVAEPDRRTASAVQLLVFAYREISSLVQDRTKRQEIFMSIVEAVVESLKETFEASLGESLRNEIFRLGAGFSLLDG